MGMYVHHQSYYNTTRHEERPAYLKIEYLRGKAGKEIRENVCDVCGGSTVLIKHSV